MTKKEKQQLKKDIKDGKVDLDELYEKYGLYRPYFMDYETYKEVYGDLTIEKYNEEIFDSEIEFLFAHIDWKALYN